MTRQAIFITGAAAGIGRATARYFVEKGWFVGLYDIDEQGVQQLAKDFGPDYCCWGRLDVTDTQAWQQQLSQFVLLTGRLDVLLNNAGVLFSGAIVDTPLSRLHQMIDINIKGVLNGCYLALPFLKQTPNARVINLCSASAIYGQPSLAVYSATKFAVRGLTEALDLEWQEDGVRVMDVLPLFVQTAMVQDMQAKALARLGVSLTPADVAATIYEAATYQRKLPRVHWTVGSQTRLFYAAARLSPDWLNRFINNRITH